MPCLRDIIENVDRILTYTHGLNRAGFVTDEKTRDAVERCIERISEAAHRLGARAAELMPRSLGPTSAAWGTD